MRTTWERSIGELASEGRPAPLFRFGVQQDEKDSSQQIRANIGQGGLVAARSRLLHCRQQALSTAFASNMSST
jgi:hypothetical protein